MYVQTYFLLQNNENQQKQQLVNMVKGNHYIKR